MRVVLAEDLALLRDGLTRLLTASGCDVVAVDDGPSLRRALVEQQPDLAVVDVRLPPTFADEGLRAAIEARVDRPGMPVLVLSQYVEALYARELLADGRGGVGYLLKDRVADIDTFIGAARTVAGGGTVMDPHVVEQMLAVHAPGGVVSQLSPRELEVLELMAQGRSNAAIAERLFVPERSVSRFSSSIFTKLGLELSDDDNRRVLAVLAYLQAPHGARTPRRAGPPCAGVP
ncbi:response regulator transcription factor [Cellulomonas chengniuliangii]|uniref:response regulator transcription factor n=1 Tax=Cellulomonas chengniuliangii TaxID=2968084 RepID=UPI001D0E6E01|nr:response regulator transcription factor [Cellulomonas chengniuliangii]MCC2318337.1 response regulator transcription factor [Cellulomonas chengniuliangii]